MNQFNISNEISGNTKAGLSGASYAKMAKSVILGTIIGVFSSVFLMIVFAFVINMAFGDPDGVINVFTGIAASAGAAIGGFYASRLNGSKGFVSGITTGFIISLVILTVMLFSGKGSEESVDTAFRIIIILCQIIFACAGGIFAVNSHKSKRSVRTYPIGKIGKK